VKPQTVEDLCKQVGINLVLPEGRPFHCGKNMRVGSGVMGPDLAECKVCGLTIGNIASPHINGGIIFTDNDDIKEGKTWVLLKPPRSTTEE